MIFSTNNIVVVKMNKFSKSLEILNNFIENKISKYSKYRNYDYGVNNTFKVVSGLLPIY